MYWSMGECSTVLSTYTKYRHLGYYCTHTGTSRSTMLIFEKYDKHRQNKSQSKCNSNTLPHNDIF